MVYWLVSNIAEEFTRRVSCGGKRGYRYKGIKERK
jgi:hypothetical protein